LIGFEVGDVVESLADVFVEEPKIRRPVVGKERARDLTVLQKDERHEGGMPDLGFLLTAFHISSSRFKIPVPRKFSLSSLHFVAAGEDWDVLTVALSGDHRDRSLCGRSPLRI
jgi:hypothetical protein